MAIFSNLSIGKKLSVGFGVLLGFMAISNIQGIYGIEVVHDSVIEIGDRNAPAMDAANQLATMLLQGQSVMQEYDSRTAVLSSQSTTGELDALKDSFSETNALFDQFVDRLVEADGRTADIVRLVKEADTIHNTRFQPLADNLMMLGSERMTVMQDRDQQMGRMEQAYADAIDQADKAETAVKLWVRGLRNAAVLPQDFNELLQNAVPFVDAAMELKISLLEARVAIEEVVQQSAMSAISPLIAEYEASNAHFDELLQAVLKGGSVDGEIVPALAHAEARGFVEALDEQHAAFQTASDAIINHQRKLLSLTAEAATTREKLFATEAEVTAIVEDIKGLTGQGMANAKASAEAGYETALHTLIAIGTLAIVVGILVGVVISRSVTVPLGRAVHCANRLAAGDLTVKMEQTSTDETGRLIAALNETSDRLRDMISSIAAATVQMTQSTNEVSTITQKTASSIEDQGGDLQQASVAMNEMSATVREVAQHATDAAAATQQADSESKSGRSLVSTVNESIQSLAEQIGRTRETINKLGAETDQVGSILTVITGIAEQTNLLALNAAIEAARAGEQGRGFAVVADEVRSLASRTQESTNTIRTMIATLKSEAQRSIDFMNEGHAQAGNAVDLSNQAASSLEEIERAVRVIAEMNIQIASSAEEQSCVAEEVNATVHRISDRGAETSAGARQIAVATEELTQLSENLKGMVSQFKIA